MTEVEHKTGTMQELMEDVKQCGFYPDKPTDESEVRLDITMAKTKLQVDEAMQNILASSGLPLYLFDYIVTSVLSDIRKADLDTIRTTHINN